jgi:tyrosyl-DNA phosphodiesterase-1
LLECLCLYDFSSARVALIPSTPGYHRLDTLPADRRGHWKLRHVIKEHCAPPPIQSPSSPAPVVCQFSSMGSLSERYLHDLYASMDVMSATRSQDERPKAGKATLQQKLQIVYPTVEEIRTSYQGYRGGSSVPGMSRNIQKAFLRPLYHKWSASGTQATRIPLWKGENVPHIKTYYQLRLEPKADGEKSASMEWFVLSSHNLSKAAWGEVQTSARFAGRRLFVRHWELGVFLSPSLLSCGRLVPWTNLASNEEDITVPLPYPLSPRPYGREDQPWAVDKRYPEPDKFGRYHCGADP